MNPLQYLVSIPTHFLHHDEDLKYRLRGRIDLLGYHTCILVHKIDFQYARHRILHDLSFFPNMDHSRQLFLFYDVKEFVYRCFLSQTAIFKKEWKFQRNFHITFLLIIYLRYRMRSCLSLVIL
jgi:hypothetical protein